MAGIVTPEDFRRLFRGVAGQFASGVGIVLTIVDGEPNAVVASVSASTHLHDGVRTANPELLQRWRLGTLRAESYNSSRYEGFSICAENKLVTLQVRERSPVMAEGMGQKAKEAAEEVKEKAKVAKEKAEEKAKDVTAKTKEKI